MVVAQVAERVVVLALSVEQVEGLAAGPLWQYGLSAAERLEGWAAVSIVASLPLYRPRLLPRCHFRHYPVCKVAQSHPQRRTAPLR